ncbi:hypothetical protein L911_0386 [Vibrio fluvialis I21563]|nr:hypothetical protein L911_0386 [Vibrio fluvialis I21563]
MKLSCIDALCKSFSNKNDFFTYFLSFITFALPMEVFSKKS